MIADTLEVLMSRLHSMSSAFVDALRGRPSQRQSRPVVDHLLA
jgi:hypothetical protein